MSESFFKEILPIVIWVAIMILSGRIKKNRKKKAPAPSPAPVPPRPARERPQPEGLTDPPGILAEALANALPQGVDLPPEVQPKVKRVVPTGVSEVLDQVLSGTAWDATVGVPARRRATQLRDPFQLLGWVDEFSEAAFLQLDDLGVALNTAVDQAVGTGEFNAGTIEEFIDRSPELTSTWSRDVFADVLGLSLFGPGFANLREHIERQRQGRDVVNLVVSGDAGALRMPYSVRQAVLIAGVRAFDAEQGWQGDEAWPKRDGEIVFDLGGLQQVPVPEEPMSRATVGILQKVVRMRIPSLDGRSLSEVWSRHPWRPRIQGQLRDAMSIAQGANVPLEDIDLLPSLILLKGLKPGEEAEAHLLALANLRRRRSRRRSKVSSSGPTLRPRSRDALVEGLLLTEILGEELGRPMSHARAGRRG